MDTQHVLGRRKSRIPWHTQEDFTQEDSEEESRATMQLLHAVEREVLEERHIMLRCMYEKVLASMYIGEYAYACICKYAYALCICICIYV